MRLTAILSEKRVAGATGQAVWLTVPAVEKPRSYRYLAPIPGGVKINQSAPSRGGRSQPALGHLEVLATGKLGQEVSVCHGDERLGVQAGDGLEEHPPAHLVQLTGH